ncbi:MAG TPA: phosphoadenylyl-sulfate reductase [Firmicutes bacterium]|nr:phosphoadenylyl-sulfate reductase [Bacillota bacterium]
MQELALQELLLQAPPESAAPQDIIKWAADTFRPHAAASCSFGGAGGMVIAHMLARCAPDIPLLFIDTGFLFPETYALRDSLIAKYGLRVINIVPSLTPEEQASRYGDKLWERDPDLCCTLRKVIPMQNALYGLKAWITSLRRDQSPTRKNTRVYEIHRFPDGQMTLKVNPLANWRREEVWDYIISQDIPYNPLLNRGYRSLGCTHCTQDCSSCPAELQDERAGRWAGRNKTECGLHTFSKQIDRLSRLDQ